MPWTYRDQKYLTATHKKTTLSARVVFSISKKKQGKQANENQKKVNR